MLSTFKIDWYYLYICFKMKENNSKSKSQLIHTNLRTK